MSKGSKTVAEILVDQMVEAGIQNVYGVVGDSANPIVDAIRRHPSEIAFIHVRNEEAGAFSAGGDALLTGRPTAVLGSAGPGSVHLLNGLYDCHHNGVPVFAIATHIPSKEIGTQYHQETYPESIFDGCSHFVGTINHAYQMPRLSKLAIEAAILQRGVGIVILPGDIAASEVEKPAEKHVISATRPRVQPSDELLDQARDLIADAKKIVIFGGEGTRGARDEVLELSERLKAPVGYSYRGKDVLEADNPNAIGMTGLLGWGSLTHELDNCDLMIMLGTDFPYRDFLPHHAKIIQVDDVAINVGRRADVDLGLVGDVGATLRALLPKLEAKADGHFLERAQKSHAKHVGQLQAYEKHQGGGKALRPEMVASTISEMADDDAVFTCDTGMGMVWGARYVQMKPGRRILASFNHGSMANAMPQAIGAKNAEPDRQVIAFCGDGGLTMLMGELVTAGWLDIPVKLMVFNNSTLGLVRCEMLTSGYEPYGTDVENPDFGKVAAAVGLHGERVERQEDIGPAVQRAFEHPGPALIDFVTDPLALSVPPAITMDQLKGFALTSGKLVLGGEKEEVWDLAKRNIRDMAQALSAEK